MTLPNQLTIFRLALTPPFFILMVVGDPAYNTFIATIIFLIAGLTDAYDGFIARKYGTVTRWGTFLDPLAHGSRPDALADFALLSFSEQRTHPGKRSINRSKPGRAETPPTPGWPQS